MEPSIQIKGDTVEEAVNTALALLGAAIEEVNITVLSAPSKSLFGLRKRPAEVIVVKKSTSKPIHEEEKIKPKVDFEQLIDTLDMFDEIESETPALQLMEKELVLSNKEGSWAQLKNGRIFVRVEGNRYPIIAPGTNVRVLVNGREIQQRTAVTAMDDITVHVTDEHIAPKMDVQVIEQDMLAVLSYEPSRRIHRSLKNIEPDAALTIEAEEEVIQSFDLEVKDVINRLEELQVKHGILKHAIVDACENPGSTDYIVAKGTYPKEGLNGDVHVLISEPDEMVWNEAEKVDYREKNLFANVEEGELIAEVIPSVPGVAGKDLLGKPVLPKPVKDVTVRLGKNVVLANKHLIAMKGGRPQLEWRGMLLKADVMEKLIHAKDVDLESGHIHFHGDVHVQGNVQESMKIESGGKVVVKGTVSKANIEAGQSVMMEKNIFSSTISAGKSNIIIDELVTKASEILYYLDHMKLAIKQLLMVRSEKEDTLEKGQLNQLIRLLLERKYTDFSNILSRFVSKINENKTILETEWIEIANRLRTAFIVLSTEQINEVAAIEDIADELRELYELYRIPVEPGCRLTVPYAINSSLYSSGDLVVDGKGLYHCRVRAGNDVFIRGVCRGGEIVAGRSVTIDEVGSEAGSKTSIQVPADGFIKINNAFEDTMIQIGRRVHTFAVADAHIHAHLNKDGMIVLR
ncbi:flagellar assembly protein A [Domibacillus tundrae]|uniref:flagellar assembly protein A n=1 Tax=Domibacillus tundrae TaxID=1587527 RepID=UPI00339AEDE3